MQGSERADQGVGPDAEPVGTAGLAALLAEPTRRVSPRAKAWWLTKVLIEAVVLLGAVGAWWWFDEAHRSWSLPVDVVLLVLTAVAAVVEPRCRYAVHRWDHTDDAVFTRSGWLTQERRVAPISRVQTVDLERGPLAQLFGLATVTVTTASAKGPVKIEGLPLADAERVVAHLTSMSAHEHGDAT